MRYKFNIVISFLYVTIFHYIILNGFSVLCDDKSPDDLHIVDYEVDSIPLEYVPHTGYVVNAVVGSQNLKLLLNSNTCGLMLFENTSKICFGDKDHTCYEPGKSNSAVWCDTAMLCIPGRFNYQCNEVSSPYDIKDLSVTPVRLESEEFKIFSIEGYENFKIAMNHRKSPFFFDKIPVKLARSLDRYDHKIFQNVHGLFGLTGSEMCCRSNVWEKISREYRGFYVLDINPPSNARFPSRLYMGTDRVVEEEVVWAEKRQLGGMFTNSFLQFTMYDLTMCEVNLFGRTTSNWEAMIDLTTPYLILPINFWITLMKYLPVDESCFKDPTRPKLCRLTNGNRYFPVLEFKLSHTYYLNFEKVDPPTLRIPLENLLHDDGNSKTVMIIPNETTDKSPYTVTPSIKLGYKVLESLLVVVDSEGYRLGLVNKNQLVGSMSKCAEVPECIGDQVYEPALNVCVDPICNVWLMKRLNPDKRICETSPLAKILITSLISLLIIAEFYCNFARRHILKITSRLCQ